MSNQDKSKDKDFAELLGMLQRATERIEEKYFMLPLAGKEDGVHRERVYCYELYHQMRQIMSACLPMNSPYVLNGEVDKRGHPLIRSCFIPDLLIHDAGNMDNNLAVIEVKFITAEAGGREKDVKSLQFFLDKAHYHRGVYLVYGFINGNGNPITKFNESLKEISSSSSSRVSLLWHEHPRKPAKIIER